MSKRLRSVLTAFLVLAVLVVLGLALMALFGAQGEVPVAQEPPTPTGTQWTYPPGYTPLPTITPTPPGFYPPPPSPGPTLTPWPTRSWPTVVPAPPPPTPWLTPVVTPIPLARPPYVPEVVGKTTQPYRIFLREGNRVWVMNHDGTDKRFVIDTTQALSKYLGIGIGTEWPIDWGGPSPDGKRLALVLCNVAKPPAVADWGAAGYGLYVVEVASGQARLLVKNAEAPVWSPNSQWLAYRPIGSSELRIADVKTGQTRLVFAPEVKGYWVASFSWSPDGKYLALCKVYDFWDNPSILVVDAEGIGKTIELVSETKYYFGRPQWSPDGRKILFVSGMGDRAGPDVSDNLWVINSDGSKRVQLTKDFGLTRPRWSPDGQWIAFVATKHYEKPDYPYDLWLIRPDDEQLRRLTGESAEVRAAQWSPDGTQIVVEREGQGIWSLDLASGDWQQVCPENLDFAVVQ